MTSQTKRVTSLERDLEDGIVLAELLENIAKDKIRYVSNPKQLRIKPQKLENLGESFRFMEEKGIKLVNIGEANSYYNYCFTFKFIHLLFAKVANAHSLLILDRGRSKVTKGGGKGEDIRQKKKRRGMQSWRNV